MDYSIGEDIKEKLIPRAVDWFTGEALNHEGAFDEMDDGEFEDEDDVDEDELSDDRDEDDESEEEVCSLSYPFSKCANSSFDLG